ncbi:MAG: endonuclease/exonuclease/phosphatase family protein [Acetobacteraceae bacterium]
MPDSLDEVRQYAWGEAPEPVALASGLRVISWNLLRLVGAGVADVAALIRLHHPDLLLMQEATEDLAGLPAAVGGYFFREPMHGRVYGLAVWSPHELQPPRRLPLPVSSMPGHFPPRVAQIVRVGAITFANVHLSHGQLLNRFQLLHIVRSLDGPAAVVGDYNAVGPIRLRGLRDVGPRQPTHIARNLISLRLDRCMVRGLRCRSARVLDRGPSDHRPIILDLDVVTDSRAPVRLRARQIVAQRWHGALGGGLGSFIRAVSPAPSHIRDALGLARQGEAQRGTRGSVEALRPAREKVARKKEKTA